MYGEYCRSSQKLTFTMVVNNLNLQILLRVCQRNRVTESGNVGVLAVLKHTQNILFDLVVSGTVGTPATHQKERLI